MKKIIILTLVALLVINPVGVYATSTAGTLEVAGSLASGGLSGGANSEMLAIAFTLMVIYGMGMSVKLTEQAQAAGETAESYLRNMFAKWVGGTSAKEMTESQREELKKRFKVISSGGSDQNGNSNNKVSKNGKIFLGVAALSMIKKFLNWLKAHNQIYPDAEIEPYPNVSMVNDTLSGAYIPGDIFSYRNGEYTIKAIKTNDSTAQYQVAIVKIYYPEAQKYVLGFYSMVDGGVESTQFLKAYLNDQPSWDSERSLYYTVGNYRFNTFYNFVDVLSPFDLLIKTIPNVHEQSTNYYDADDSMRAYLTTLNGAWNESTSGSGDAEDHIDGNYNSEDLNNQNDGYTLIDPALYQQLLQGLDANTLATINIADYVNAILQQLNRKSNPSAVPQTENVPLVNPTDLSPIPQPLPDPAADPTPVTLPKDEPAPGDNDPPADSDPVSNPDPAPPDVSVPMMVFDLREYFPFCLPFDVYDIFSKFVADPQAPAFDIPFEEPFSGSQTTIHVDLSPFNTIMAAVRQAELVAFVVGLALVTKSMFAN